MPTIERSEDLNLQKLGFEMRLSYVQHCFKPTTTDRGMQQFQLTGVYPKGTDDKALKDLVLAVAEKSWPGQAATLLKSGVIKSPFLDGDGPQGHSKKTGAQHDGMAGQTFIRLTSGGDYPPGMFVTKNGAAVPATPADIRSGDYGFIILNAFSWDDGKGGKGLSFGFSGVMKSRDGERLGGGGGGATAKDFDAIPDQGAAPDATTGGDGAAGMFGASDAGGGSNPFG